MHPLHEKWEDQGKFDMWKNGYPYYDEWWSKKRQEYKEQIMAIVKYPKTEIRKQAKRTDDEEVNIDSSGNTIQSDTSKVIK